ncbi:MAG: hypothetical protein SGPRY_011569 [Prymnesium sp.]
MLVSVPIHYDRDLDLSRFEGDPGAAIHAALSAHYEGAHFVREHPLPFHSAMSLSHSFSAQPPPPRAPPLAHLLCLLTPPLCPPTHWSFTAQVKVMPLGEADWKEAGLLERDTFLRADALNDSNRLEIFVYCNEARRTCVVAARLDNLGKGASGAAVQNLNIALGLDEATGL